MQWKSLVEKLIVKYGDDYENFLAVASRPGILNDDEARALLAARVVELMYDLEPGDIEVNCDASFTLDFALLNAFMAGVEYSACMCRRAKVLSKDQSIRLFDHGPWDFLNVPVTPYKRVENQMDSG